MIVTAILPSFKYLNWEPLEPTPAFPYRWKAKRFENLRLESHVQQPLGLCWEMKLKRDDGKNRERTFRYPLNLRLQLLSLAKSPTHNIEWVFDAGKFVEVPECSYSAVFPGVGNSGWLLLVVRSRLTQVPTGKVEEIPVLEKKAVASPRDKQVQGIGAGTINQERTNEERIEEVVALVTIAIANLRLQHDWEGLKVREKIKLLQQETLNSRGAAVSSQTLYRPWIRNLWQ